MKKLSNSHGFTLIELMVVIAIIGLLASTVLAALSNARMSARDVTRVSSVKELQKALELYRNANNGQYPCATAACAAGGAAMISVNSTSTNAVFDAAIAPYYQPVKDVGNGYNGTIFYRVRSTAGASNNSPDRSSYTIILRREGVNSIPSGTLNSLDYCSISVGAGHDGWNTVVTATNYPACY